MENYSLICSCFLRTESQVNIQFWNVRKNYEFTLSQNYFLHHKHISISMWSKYRTLLSVTGESSLQLNHRHKSRLLVKKKKISGFKNKFQGQNLWPSAVRNHLLCPQPNFQRFGFRETIIPPKSVIVVMVCSDISLGNISLLCKLLIRRQDLNWDWKL